MKREVVQDFLNLPGIEGVALLDGRSRPYFYGVDRALNFQQKEALAQGIQQVIDTTPSDFEFFEFQFSGHQVYIYKLNHGVIFLVLATSELVYTTFAEVIERFKAELQDVDIVNAITTFRLLAGSTTLSGQHYWKHPSDKPPALPSPVSSASTAGIPATDNAPIGLQPQSASPSVYLKDVLAALNQLSQFTTQYLGPTVVTNYWKTTRPAIDWLNHFQVERSAQITLTAPLSPDAALAITAEQHQWLRQWVAAFIGRCSKVIRDFPKTVRQSTLSDRQKFLLLSDPP
jgi:hypothetical protein